MATATPVASSSSSMSSSSRARPWRRRSAAPPMAPAPAPCLLRRRPQRRSPLALVAAAAAAAAAAAVAVGWLGACPVAAAEDLADELYRAAEQSPEAHQLATMSDFDAFVGEARPAPTVVVMLHSRKCSICQSALPEFVAAAKRLKGSGAEEVRLGHLECSKFRDQAIGRFRLKGFPTMLVFRQRQVRDADTLVNQTVRVTDDRDLLLRAARLADMSQDKDDRRLQWLGKEGQVVMTDVIDGTAFVSMPGKTVTKVWFPMESLRLPTDGGNGEGRAFFRREEAAVVYKGSWSEGAMISFTRRMLAPLIVDVGSREEGMAVAGDEPSPSLFFCGGGEATEGFVAGASSLLGRVRAFRAKEPGACPAALPDVGPGDPHVLVYSPAGMLWYPGAHTSRSAVAGAGPDIVRNDSELAEWIGMNRFPGIHELGFHNFADFVNSGRRCLILALQKPRVSSPDSKSVFKRLYEVAKPVDIDDARSVLYTYSPNSFYYGVVDGTLPGMEDYGISPESLPRALVFEDSDTWIEDEYELTVLRLAQDLSKLPRLWRTHSGVLGGASWFLRSVLKRYWRLDGAIVEFLGGSAAGRLVLPSLLAGSAIAFVYLAYSLVRAIIEGDDEVIELNAGAPQAAGGHAKAD